MYEPDQHRPADLSGPCSDPAESGGDAGTCEPGRSRCPDSSTETAAPDGTGGTSSPGNTRDLGSFAGISEPGSSSDLGSFAAAGGLSGFAGTGFAGPSDPG